jgi:hypothetical protein
MHAWIIRMATTVQGTTLFSKAFVEVEAYAAQAAG